MKPLHVAGPRFSGDIILVTMVLHNIAIQIGITIILFQVVQTHFYTHSYLVTTQMKKGDA